MKEEDDEEGGENEDEGEEEENDEPPAKKARTVRGAKATATTKLAAKAKTAAPKEEVEEVKGEGGDADGMDVDADPNGAHISP